MRKLRFFLDANVLVSARLRDLYLGFAELGLIDVRWSVEVLDEVERALTTKIGLPGHKAARLLSALTDFFPLAAVVWSPGTASSFELPDPDDHHVLAAAIDGECDFLITDNIVDFPEEALPRDAEIWVLNADEGLQFLGTNCGPEVLQVLQLIEARKKDPLLSVNEIVDGLEEIAPLAATVLAAALGHDDAQVTLANTMAALSDGSPQSVVNEAISCLRDGDEQGFSELVSADLRRRSHDADTDPFHAAVSELAEILATPPGQLSIPANPRLIDANRALVKLVQLDSDRIEVVREPSQFIGYMFWLTLENGQWFLDDVGGEDPAIRDDNRLPNHRSRP